MKYFLNFVFCISSVFGWYGAAHAETSNLASLSDEDIALQIKEIKQKREQIEAQLLADRVNCYQKFAVNTCIYVSRQSQRKPLEDLRKEELVLRSEQRKRTAAARLALIEEKKQAAKVRAEEDAERLKAYEANMAQVTAENDAKRQNLDADAAARLRRQEEKLKRAEAKIAEYERKQKEREQQGKGKPMGLPVP